MHSSRNNNSTITNIIQSTGFLPLIFVIVSVTLWVMFINSYHNKTTEKEPRYISDNTAATFSGKSYFEQQNLITRPEPNIQDLQTLTMQLMEKYQGLELAEDKKYIESLGIENRISTSFPNKNRTIKDSKMNRMDFKTDLVSPNPLQSSVNKLLLESQDTIDTDYMNNLNIDSVTSIKIKG